MSDILDIVDTLDQEYLPTDSQNPEALEQMLSDLGYLPVFNGQSSLNSSSDLDQAMNSFKAELKESGLLPQAEINQINQIYGEQSDEKILELCLDMDEGLKFNALPTFRDRGLQVRIIHYRLHILGVYHQAIDAYYSSSSYSGLQQLTRYTGKTLLSTLNLLSDLQEFTVTYLKERGFEQPISIFRVSPSVLENLRDDQGKKSKLPDYTGAFKRAVKRELKNHPDVFKKLRDSLFKKDDDDVNEQVALTMSRNEDNAFIIRLIQIHQWMAGFYHGRLDGELGPVTINSLREIISSYNDSGEDIDEKKALVVLVEKDGIIAFNTIFFLNKYKVEHSQSDKTIQTLETINNSYQNAKADDQKDFRDNFTTGIKDIRNGKDPSSREGKGFLGRIFGGIRSFFKKIFRFASKIFGWIARKVGKALSFITSFLKKIYEVIKQAAHHFIEGVKFLLGRTTILSGTPQQNIITQFNVDKDVINLVQQLDEAILTIHKAKVNEKVQSLKFSLMLIALLFKTIKVLLVGAIVAWPIFLLKLAKSFKQLTDQYKLIQNT